MQVPFFRFMSVGPLKIGNFDRVLQRICRWFGILGLGRTGKQLFVLDKRRSRDPLVVRGTVDLQSDHVLSFLPLCFTQLPSLQQNAMCGGKGRRIQAPRFLEHGQTEKRAFCAGTSPVALLKSSPAAAWMIWSLDRLPSFMSDLICQSQVSNM